jgi:uncharacterized RDD family membrane protein YckC
MSKKQLNEQHKKIVTFLSLGVFILIAYILLGASGLVDNENYRKISPLVIGFSILFGGYGLYLMSKKYNIE